MHHSLGEIESLLEGHIGLLWRNRRTAPPRQRTLNATLDWSHELISDVERIVFRRLAVLVGPFTLEAAKAVARDEQLNNVEVIDALEQLVAKSSIFSGAANEPRIPFRLLDVTRTYAHLKLCTSKELNSVCLRHARYMLTWLEHCFQNNEPTSERRRSLNDQLGNLRAALTWCFSDAGDNHLGRQLTTHANSLFLELSLLEECREWSERALSTLDQSTIGSWQEIVLQSSLGHALMYTMGNSERAKAAMERGLELAKSAGASNYLFRTLISLHTLHRRTGEYSSLMPLTEQAERLAARIDDPYTQSAVDVLYGITYQLAGAPSLSVEHLQRSLTGPWQQQEAGSQHFAYVGNTRLVLTMSLWLAGFPDQSVEIAADLIESPKTPDSVMFCAGLSHAAIVMHQVGDDAAAESVAERMITTATNHALVPYIAVGNGFRGITMIHTGDISNGIAMLQSVIKTLRANRYELYAGYFVRSLTCALTEIGNHQLAQSMLDQSIAFAEQHNSFELPEFHRVRGELLESTNNEADAEQSYRSALNLAKQQGALSWELRAGNSLLQLLIHQGRSDEFYDFHTTTYALFSEGFDTADLCTARHLQKVVRNIRS